MARSRSAQDTTADPRTVIRQLCEVANGDVVYRDLYLERAASLMQPILSRVEHDQLRTEEAEVEALIARTRRATQAQDWTLVQQLSASASGVRRLLAEKSADRSLAAAVYNAAEVVLDPFSIGLDAVAGPAQVTPEAIRSGLVSAFTHLVKVDAEWSEFYRQRSSRFAAMSVAEATVTKPKATADDRSCDLEAEALRAAELGDFDRLNQLAAAMLAAAEKPQPVANAKAASAERTPTIRRALPQLGEPLPTGAIERGRTLGLEAVEASLAQPALRAALTQFTERFAWHPGIPPEDLARQGVSHLKPLLQEVDLPGELREPIVEAFALFALHVYVNSAGVRYLPLFADSEWVMIEDFPEDSPPAESSLLTMLGLQQRSALSRVEIERALQRHGPNIVGNKLGLDARKYRLTCIPFDLYARIGQDRGWGQQPHWTHVDGYQVLKGGALRALVSGDRRYGGLLDLCSISTVDQREGVGVRFAIVQRERLATS